MRVVLASASPARLATLRSAGLDPWVIEKRRGSLRLRASAVRLHQRA